MDALRLSRLNTAVLVTGVGLAAGHLLMPFSPGAGAGPRVALAATMLALGGLRGWRDAALRDVRAPRAVALTALAFALGALALAVAGYVVVHGVPR